MKNIISGKNRPSVYGFETAAQIISEKLRAGDTKIYMSTELGHLLIEVDPNVLNVGDQPLHIYPWGNEPKTRLTCEYRHREVDFYAKVKYPSAWRRRHITQAMTLAIMIMGGMFVIKIIDQRSIYNRNTFQSYLDAVVHAWSETAQSFENNPTVHSIVELEHRKDLYALQSNVRRVAYNLVNEISRQRTAEADELISKSEQEILEDTKENPIVVDQLSKFWNMMLCIGQKARKDEYRWNFVRENSTEGYLKFSKEHPDLRLTPCQIVMTILTSSRFSVKATEEKKDREEDQDEKTAKILREMLRSSMELLPIMEEVGATSDINQVRHHIDVIKKGMVQMGIEVPSDSELMDEDLLTCTAPMPGTEGETTIPNAQAIDDIEDDDDDDEDDD